MDGDARQLSGLHQLSQEKRDQLGASYRERRNQDGAPARYRLTERPADLIDQRRRIMEAVTVCGFEHQSVAGRKIVRIRVKRSVVTPDVATKDNSMSGPAGCLYYNFGECRSQDVPGIQQSDG